MNISEAIAAPRAAQRNSAKVTAEPGFIAAYESKLAPFGHEFTPSGDAFTSAAEIGAATAIEFKSGGRLVAAAEPARRGGGSAMVVKPAR
jgi:gamma-glutamyltranspeptidase/glutathione hydrolase